jgi:CelD/BcsL family acetyltransferase involved in cellulose biosynthesis
MAVVGGNLADIDSNVTKLEATGASAEASGGRTSQEAGLLAEAIETATANLITRFQQIAADLDQDIRAAATKLETSEWEGHSKRRAVEIKGELQGQVNTVMVQATQLEYTDLAAAARKTRENFAAADQTII